MAHIIDLLLAYKYLILFPLAVVEGPIITVIAGLFVRTGVLSFFAVYSIVVIGDAFGDSIAYAVGRFGGPAVLKKFGNFFGVTDAKVAQAREYFINNRHKTLILSKIIHGVGVAGLVTAGNLKVPYRRFFLICLMVSLIQSMVFLLLGVLFGHAYVTFGKYFDFFGRGTIIIGICIALVAFFWYRIKKK